MESDLRKNTVEMIFSERKNFIIIGLTGRTGSGCSYVSDLLKKNFLELQPPKPKNINEGNLTSERQYSVIYNYAKENWKPFIKIEMKNILLTFILENNFDTVYLYLKKLFPQEVHFEELNILKNEYKEMYDLRLSYKKQNEKINTEYGSVTDENGSYEYYFKKIPEFSVEFLKIFKNLASRTKFLQKIGNNIRSTGQAFEQKDDFEKIFVMPQRVNLMIKILRKRNLKEKKQVIVVIDALRNPYEATFFRDRYSSFYLLSVNTDNETRIARLHKKELTDEDIKKLDKIEYPKETRTYKDFYSINIQKTIELANVHLNNSLDSSVTENNSLKQQLLRYVSLIMHPGIVSPTEIERCMQLSNTAQLNSSCLSRQVGATVTDANYNLLSIGWNSSPKNQMPCNLRTANSIIREDMEDKIGLSKYEKTNSEFRDFVKQKYASSDLLDLQGKNCAFCFKDIYNEMKGNKNQVYTRSIHAEEMAFLQLSQNGNSFLKKGILFTTASPCELCSKKACQLGIEKIYYIDQYPGISNDHILQSGEDTPEMILFQGAIGRAYNLFYSQIMPYKDELYMILGVNN